jgi:hypothetical protein
MALKIKRGHLEGPCSGNEGSGGGAAGKQRWGTPRVTRPLKASGGVTTLDHLMGGLHLENRDVASQGRQVQSKFLP